MVSIGLLIAVAAVVGALSALAVYSIQKAKYAGRLAAKDASIEGLTLLRDNEKALYEKTLQDLKASGEKAIEAAKAQLALENEKTLKAREESLKKEASETIKNITQDLDKDIRSMKEAFEAQKKSHSEDNSSLKEKFDATVKQIREQADKIGVSASDLSNALKGKNKMQGIFGETVLENILRKEGLTKGIDYDSEFYLRDSKGSIIRNEVTDKRMRPDFVLHFPDNTDVIIDAKVSLTALADYFEADSDAARADAARRNLDSVRSHIKELASKEYQKYVEGRNSLDFVIMFVPNYGAYQLAKQEDENIFADAFRQNVLITTEETLLPFVRLIRSAWVQKAQIDNMNEIVAAAGRMVDRVALFCEENVKLGAALERAAKVYEENTKRLTDGQSILKAARDVSALGIKTTSRELPPVKE